MKTGETCVESHGMALTADICVCEPRAREVADVLLRAGLSCGGSNDSIPARQWKDLDSAAHTVARCLGFQDGSKRAP